MLRGSFGSPCASFDPTYDPARREPLASYRQGGAQSTKDSLFTVRVPLIAAFDPTVTGGRLLRSPAIKGAEIARVSGGPS
eukprot:1189405-Prorocentrum_minimum.AAC.3